MKSFILFLMLCTILPIGLRATPSPSDYCHDIALIANAAVQDGLLSESEAEELTLRCYDLENRHPG